MAAAQLAPPIVNTTGQFLAWGDYRIEVNQHGDLGRNWPTPELFWKGYEILKARAKANPNPPNPLRTILLIIVRVEATAVKQDEAGKEIVVGRKTTEMTTAEIKWNLEQWREFEEMVYVFSGGNAWLRTDIKVIDEPLQVKTDENWGFWAGQQRALLDKYLPFERGDYQSYNCIYNSRGLNANPHGGTIGAVGGIKGCGTSDNAFYGAGRYIDERSGYVALHEWLNQQCSATSNMMPYPDGEALWNNYVLHTTGYREDTGVNPWPWISHRRDVMTQVIRPTMWRRWSALDPYRSLPVGRWTLFAGYGPDTARAVAQAPARQGTLVEQTLGRYSNLTLTNRGDTQTHMVPTGTLHFRTYVQSDKNQEVRIWTGADERFQLWLNGTPWAAPDGTEYNPPSQHLFLEVPEKAVASPWIPKPEENSGWLNNDLDFNWKSMAWLRLKDRAEPRDVVLVRFDIAEPLFHLLTTRGRPAHESLVGWLLAKHKLAYVLAVDLNLETTPRKALDLLTQRPK
ncbi:MAG: hypothetical protein JXQ71_11375 [Verrucomicrobia bacterium]|nr:hypothetical protein [Verrucomicrobiota bacterium]